MYISIKITKFKRKQNIHNFRILYIGISFYTIYDILKVLPFEPFDKSL